MTILQNIIYNYFDGTRKERFCWSI